jgi:hypothetical protein
LHEKHVFLIPLLILTSISKPPAAGMATCLLAITAVGQYAMAFDIRVLHSEMDSATSGTTGSQFIFLLGF